ncbi:TraX protein [Lachnospiraceae bacterium]|nr:TraX protein [Lachnospiraceae bacterium]
MNAFSLKLLACIAMLIDHIGSRLYPKIKLLRYIGRLAFPIYAFLLVEGFCHTRDVKKYLARLFAFALVSEVPFDLYFRNKFFDPLHQNVFFTLFLGLMALQVMKESNSIYLKIVAVAAFGGIAQAIHSDYRYIGVLMVCAFYWFRKMEFCKWNSIIILNFRLFKSSIQSAGSLALLPISLYNGKKGPGFKYFFYAFYPGHLLILHWIKMRYFQ